MIGSDLLRFNTKQILLVDTETQRLNLLDDNLPFQCSWIVTDKYNLIKKVNHYIKWPNFKMSKDAARITRFQQEWVDNGDDPEEVLEEFESDLFNENYDLVGQNILSFDIYIWNLWRKKLGKKPIYSHLKRLYDTSFISKAYKLGLKPDRNNLLAWQYKVMSIHAKGIKTNLNTMAKELEIEVDENRLHEASYDLEINDKVFRKLIWLIEI